MVGRNDSASHLWLSLTITTLSWILGPWFAWRLVRRISDQSIRRFAQQLAIWRGRIGQPQYHNTLSGL